MSCSSCSPLTKNLFNQFLAIHDVNEVSSSSSTSAQANISLTRSRYYQKDLNHALNLDQTLLSCFASMGRYSKLILRHPGKLQPWLQYCKTSTKQVNCS